MPHIFRRILTFSRAPSLFPLPSHNTRTQRFLWSRWWLAYSMNSMRVDGDRTAVPMSTLPSHSEDQVRYAFRSLRYFPALEHETDLSNSFMVALNASLLIANRLPIGDKSSTTNGSITP